MRDQPGIKHSQRGISTSLTLRPTLMLWWAVSALGVVALPAGVLLLAGVGAKAPLWGGLLLIAIGLAALAGGIAHVGPNAAHLQLTAEGFEVKSMWRGHFVRWSEVAGFDVGGYIGEERVVWDWAPGARAASKDRFTGIIGAEAALLDLYGHPPEKLARLMNERRERGLGISPHRLRRRMGGPGDGFISH